MEPIYIRTQKDGTKIFHDFTCDRCGGLGFSKAWAMTGGYCYKCGGSGKLSRPRIVKEYSEEGLAKLREKEAKKRTEQEKRQQEEIAERLANPSRQYAKLGCNADGIGYVLKGDTYPHKEQIKKLGGKWHIWCWVCPVKFEADGVEPVQIDVSSLLDDYGLIDADDMIWEAQRKY